MIEYGPVEIGGKTYDCPLRSVSIMRSRSVGILSEWGESFRTYGPYATMLNDVHLQSLPHVSGPNLAFLPGFTPEEK